MSQSIRVLLLADSCNPDWPSLPAVGYKACRALGDHVEAVVATHIRNRPAIEREGFGHCEVVFLDNEYIGVPMGRLAKVLRGGTSVAWTMQVALSYPAYLAFERECWRRFGADLRAGRFDVVHRVTPMSPTILSPMAKWSPVPFVLGPLNGGLKWPPQFREELAREREWLTYVRSLYRRMPYYRATYRRAAAILAAFRHTVDDLPRWSMDRIIDFPEIGIDPELFSISDRRPPGARMTFLYVGRLVPYKCPDVAVEAFAASSALRRHTLQIVGDGPERPRLEQTVRERGLGGCVELVGQRTQAQVGQLMREADVFVFPSIRELGAGALVEAMACGLACVIVNYGAPGSLVDPTRGIRVPIGPKPQLIADYARELESLANDPERVVQLGAAARAHAMAHYTWDSKARAAVEVYRWVLGRRTDKPAGLF
jgi:glycosyltransferase involved in cell wall biosynthesis